MDLMEVGEIMLLAMIVIAVYTIAYWYLVLG